MKKYYLAIDIGATSGRHILAHYDENNELVWHVFELEERKC